MQQKGFSMSEPRLMKKSTSPPEPEPLTTDPCYLIPCGVAGVVAHIHGEAQACSITSNGKVKGCLSLPDHLVEGDLRENDLWDIWFHPDAFAYTRNFSIEDLGQNCRSCPMGEQCKGGCSAMSYSYTGRFHNDPYCFYAFEQRSERTKLAA